MPSYLIKQNLLFVNPLAGLAKWEVSQQIDNVQKFVDVWILNETVKVFNAICCKPKDINKNTYTHIRRKHTKSVIKNF